MMDIAYTIDHNYIKYLYISLLSLLESNKGSDILIHVLSYDLTADDEKCLIGMVENFGQKILFRKISDIEKFKDRTSAGYGVEVYLRLYLPQELAGVQKVLFLDADTIVQGDLSKLFDVNMDGMALAACRDGQLGHNLLKSRNDIFGRTDDFSYYNAGVMMWNLDYMREHVVFEDYIRTMDLFGNRLFFNDQDILNYLFYRKIIDLGSYTYNYMTNMFKERSDFEEQVKKSIVIHFAGTNPWKTGKNKRIDNKIWWEFAEKSPFYEEIVENTLYNVAMTLEEEIKRNRIYKAYSEFKLNGESLKDCEVVKNSRRMVIYGAGSWGRLLLEELGENIERVVHIVDKTAGGDLNEKPIEDIDVLSVDTTIDLVIITPYKYAEDIRKEIEARVDSRVISLVDLFEGM